MWLSLTACIAVCVLLVEAIIDRELESKFQSRTPGEWETEWHQERFSRCRNSLKRHLEWACEKDIYKLKRSDNALIDFVPTSKKAANDVEDLDDDVFFPWVSTKWAYGMLRSKRGLTRRSGEVPITKECCSSKGCTWEEYAEYCIQNNRKVPHKDKRYEYVTDY